MRKTAVELPQRLGIVPAVVEDHGVDDHAALLDQVLAAEADRLQAVRLVQGEGIPGDVVPGVVVQEGAIGMGPFALQIIKERAAHLARRRHADHEALRDRFSLVQRRVPPQAAGDLGPVGRIQGVRVFNAEEEIAGHQRRAVDQLRPSVAPWKRVIAAKRCRGWRSPRGR